MEKHFLLNEFPEFSDKIHELKATNDQFRHFYEEYDLIDHHVYRIENGTEPTTDEHLNELRLKRVQLKDILYGMLNQ